jgi:hypothetical protein
MFRPLQGKKIAEELREAQQGPHQEQARDERHYPAEALFYY